MHNFIQTKVEPKIKYIHSFSFDGTYDDTLDLQFDKSFNSLDTKAQFNVLHSIEQSFDHEFWNLRDRYGYKKLIPANTDDRINVDAGNKTYEMDSIYWFTDAKGNQHDPSEFELKNASDSNTGNVNTYVPVTNLTSSKKSEAWTLATHLVKQRLKSPSTAKFPWYNSDYISLENGLIVVTAYVDAENGFGAKVRANFTVKLDGVWNTVSVNIQQ